MGPSSGWGAVAALTLALGAAPAPAHVKRAERTPDGLTALVTQPDERPRGTVIVLRGGGWAGPAPRKLPQYDARYGALFADAGYRTVVADYPANTAGLDAVLRLVAAERRVDGPVCLWGESAGAHLALLAAARQPRVSCVIAVAAPLDFDAMIVNSTALQQVAAALPPSRAAERIRAIAATRAWWGARGRTLFGAALPAWTPLRYAARTTADVMLVHAARDPVVPPEQADLYERADPTATVYKLPYGPEVPLSHITVTQAAFDHMQAASLRAVARARRAYRAYRLGATDGCGAAANRPLTALARPQARRAVRCLLDAARRRERRPRIGTVPAGRPARARAARAPAIRVRGHITPARVVLETLASRDGRRLALRRHVATVGVELRRGRTQRAALLVR